MKHTYLKKRAPLSVKRTVFLVTLLVAVIAVSVAAIFLFDGKSEDSAQWRVPKVIEGDQTPAAEITTPYGNVHLEGDWVSYLRYKIVKGDSARLGVAAELGEEIINLFDLYFDQAAENPLGYLTSNAGTGVPVSVIVHEIVPRENWTSKETEQVYAMQDCLNDILVQLGLEMDLDGWNEMARERSVKTSFGVFTYKDFWNNAFQIRVEEDDGCLISGYGTVANKPEQHLFDITIGGAGESLLGMVADGKPVYLTVPDLSGGADWSEEDINTLYRMRDVLNEILDQLDLEKVVQQEEIPEDIMVNTPYGMLSYPGVFDGKLQIEQDESNGYCLSAYAEMEGKEKIHLFDILVGVEGEEYIGILKKKNGEETVVYLNIYDLQFDGTWANSECDIIYGMQGLFNEFILQMSVSPEMKEELPEEMVETEPTFETEEAPQKTTSVADVVIQTTYGDLRFPGEHKEYLRTDRNLNNGYTVAFSAKMMDGRKVALFDFTIGGTGDVYIGTLNAKNGNSGEVYITSYDFEPDSTWSEDEIQVILAMQESVNYILEDLIAGGLLTV